MKTQYYVIILLVVLAGAGAYLFYEKKKKDKEIDEETTDGNNGGRSKGSEAVKNLQRALNHLNIIELVLFDGEELKIDGIIGPKTQALIDKYSDDIDIQKLLKLI